MFAREEALKVTDSLKPSYPGFDSAITTWYEISACVEVALQTEYTLLMTGRGHLENTLALDLRFAPHMFVIVLRYHSFIPGIHITFDGGFVVSKSKQRHVLDLSFVTDTSDTAAAILTV